MQPSIASGLVVPWLLVCVLAGSPAHGQDASAPRRMPSAAERAQRPIDQANALLRDKRHSEALRVLDDALKGSPRDPQLRFLYGLVLADEGRTQEAIDVFQQLTNDFPELPEPYNNLAVLHAGRGDLDQARVALENAVRALPTYPLARENLGDVYLRMAVREYQEASRLAPASDSTRNKLAMSRELLERVAPRPAGNASGGAAAR